MREKGKTMMDRDRELHEMADEGRALMSDYINREDTIKAIESETYRHDYLDHVIDIIEAIPSADVAPVRRGRWKREYGHYKCSLCNGLDDFVDNYCPDCGAFMNREVD